MLLRILALVVAASTCLVALLLASSGAISDGTDAATRIVLAASVLVTSGLGGVGGLVLAAVGPWRASAVATIAFAVAGVAAAVAFGVDLVGGPLAPAASTFAVVVALVVHLVTSPTLADEER